MLDKSSKIKYYKKKDYMVREIAPSYHIFNYITKDTAKSLSVVIGKAVNHKEITSNSNSDRVYYVLRGIIQVNNNKVTSGEMIYIPKNTKYRIQGTFEVLIINSPAFNLRRDMTEVIKD